MGRISFSIGVALLLTSSHAQVQKVIIKESAMFNENKYFITADSIKVTQKLMDTISSYNRALSETESQAIFKMLASVDIRKLKHEYYKQTSETHDWMYEVTLQSEKEYKAIRIYKYKLTFLSKLVKQTNKFLPKEYQIHYKVDYFNEPENAR